MRTWTDEELGKLISTTMSAQENGADSATAHRIAVGARKRGPRWPTVVAAAALVGLVVGTTAHLVAPGNESDIPAGRPTETPPFHGVRTGTDAEYRAEASQEADRLLNLVRAPAGAVRLAGPPRTWPFSDDVPTGRADRRLLRSSWYSTGLDADEVETFLLAHPPSGFAKTMPGLARRASGLRYFAYDTAERKVPEVVAFSRILVQWHQAGDRTTLRFSTVMLSRRARTLESVITGVVTSVDVDRVRRDLDSQNFLEPTALPRLTVTDKVRTTALVDAANAIYGSDDPQMTGHCPFPGNPPPGTTLTFHSSVATWKFSWTDSCFDQVAVARDGERLDLTLDPSGLERLVDRILGP